MRSLVFAAAILFLTMPVLWAGDSPLVLTEELQLKVADAFMQEKEYYRAITEYKRFLILFPDSDRSDYALFQTGIASLRGGDNDGAVKTFEAMRERFPQSRYVADALYFEGMADWKAKRRDEARDLFVAVADAHPDSPVSPRALAAASLVELDNDNLVAAAALLARFVDAYPDHSKADNVREAMAMLDAYDDLPRKSEVLAGIMSALLPGAGYAYAGDYGTAVMSLLVNGAFIAGTWTAFAHDLYALGALAGGVGLPFYIGNIYGSALAVKKRNQAVKREAQDRIRASLDFVFE